MHEASLAGGVLQLVEEAARHEGFARLLALRLEAGQLAGVDARALRFALESLAPGTLLEGARIDIEEPPGQAWCMPARAAWRSRSAATPARPAAATSCSPRAAWNCASSTCA